MSVSTPSPSRRFVRPLGYALILVAMIVGGILGPEWFDVLVPPKQQFRAMIAGLRAVRSGYVGVVLAMPWASLALVIAMAIGHRRRSWRPVLLRGLTAFVAIATALAVAEGITAARLAAMRVPMPRLRERFPDPIDDRVVDIVILGASSACGVPYHEWLSVGEIVAWRLREAVPGQEFAVTYLAAPALKLDDVHVRLTKLRRRPGLVILYAGHNEFAMRHDWAHGAPHYLDEIPRRRVTFRGWIGDHSSVCRVIDATVGLFLRAEPPTRTVARHLVDVPVYTAGEYADRLRDFRARLEAITSYCERVGARVVLVIPPGNDADFEPNRSFLPADTPNAEREAFARDFEATRCREADDPDRAAAAYRALLGRQPSFAEAHYRLAKLEERAGRLEEADRHYVEARDRDGLPMRCPSEFQDAYREVAARHPGAILIDGPAVFRALSPRRTAGDTFFTDGFHPSLIGYTALAGAILDDLRDRRAFGWTGTLAKDSSPGPGEVARHFGMDARKWRIVCENAAWFYRHTAAVRFDPSERRAKAERYRQGALRIGAGTSPEDVGIPGIGTRLDVGSWRRVSRRETSAPSKR